MVRFHVVYESINQAVEGMPYEELGISEEEKEQVDKHLHPKLSSNGKFRNRICYIGSVIWN